MAEEIIVNVRPDLEAARRQQREQQAAQERLERQRRETAREEQRAADVAARRPAGGAARRQPRRGRLAEGVVAGGARAGRAGQAAIQAALVAAGIEASTQFLLPLIESNAAQVDKLTAGATDLEGSVSSVRQALEEFKVFVASTFSAISQTRESLTGAAILGAQIEQLDVGGTFEARRRVAYLREASRNVVESDQRAKAVKGIIKGFNEKLHRNIAGKK